MHKAPEMVPLLVVRGAADAIDFYVKALGAEVLARYQHGPLRYIGHADLAAAGVSFSLTEEARAWGNDAPPSLGGSPVVLQLLVEDVAAVVASMQRAGATVVFPPQRLLGERMARVRDPFGHIWLLRQPIEALSSAELQRQRDELYARFAAAAEPAVAVAPAQATNTAMVRETPAQQQAQNRAAEPPASTTAGAHQAGRVHLVIGPVGAGKSTFACKLADERAALRLTLDDWMAVLFRPDRPEDGVMTWYRERTARCVEQIWAVARETLERGIDAVLEVGMLQRDEREQMYQRIHDADLDMVVYVLDAARDVRRARVERRNRVQGATFAMVVPPAIFEYASDLWAAPDDAECEGRDVRFIRTDPP
ncbi:MAG: hypothetical protein Tsb0020_40570 [Haliangiales bacterium]